MSLPLAFCKEAGRVIDVIEARQLFFAQPEERRRRLNFTCADETCRTVREPVVTGVNYDKIPGEDHMVRQAHFAVRARHVDDCPWVELESFQGETDQGKVSPKMSNLKHIETITHFVPVLEEGDQTGDVVDYGRLRQIHEISHVRERRQALQDYLHATINRTSRLYSVTRCFEAMSDEERGAVQLQINTRTRTYGEYFAKVQWCSPEHYWNRIYHGKAHVKSYRTGYSLRFEQRSRARENGTYPVSVFITKQKLDAFRGGGLLKAVFAEAEARGKGALYCYVYGEVKRNTVNEREVIEVIPESLHSLAVELLLPQKIDDSTLPSGADIEIVVDQAGCSLEALASRNVPVGGERVKAAAPGQTLIPANSRVRSDEFFPQPDPNAEYAFSEPGPQTVCPLPVSDSGVASRSAAPPDDVIASGIKVEPLAVPANAAPVHSVPDVAVGQDGTYTPKTSDSDLRQVTVPQNPISTGVGEMARPGSGSDYASSDALVRKRGPGARQGEPGANEVPLVSRDVLELPRDLSMKARTPRRRLAGFLRRMRNRLFGSSGPL